MLDSFGGEAPSRFDLQEEAAGGGARGAARDERVFCQSSPSRNGKGSRLNQLERNSANKPSGAGRAAAEGGNVRRFASAGPQLNAESLSGDKGDQKYVI